MIKDILHGQVLLLLENLEKQLVLVRNQVEHFIDR